MSVCLSFLKVECSCLRGSGQWSSGTEDEQKWTVVVAVVNESHDYSGLLVAAAIVCYVDNDNALIQSTVAAAIRFFY